MKETKNVICVLKLQIVPKYFFKWKYKLKLVYPLQIKLLKLNKYERKNKENSVKIKEGKTGNT